MTCCLPVSAQFSVPGDRLTSVCCLDESNFFLPLPFEPEAICASSTLRFDLRKVNLYKVSEAREKPLHLFCLLANAERTSRPFRDEQIGKTSTGAVRRDSSLRKENTA